VEQQRVRGYGRPPRWALSSLDLVVVSGAGRGIGRAIALDLGDRDLPVLCVSRSERAAETAAEIRARGGRAESLMVDLADYVHAGQATTHWLRERRPRRLAVVLAAAELGPRGPFGETDLSEWDHCFRVNALGNLALVQGLLPTMIEARFGRIVFLAGGGAAYAYPVFPAYAASKAAIVRIVENLHEDLSGRGDFAVVALAPGAVDTETLRRVRSAGGAVRTVTDVSEPVECVRALITSDRCNLSGTFIHVRDEWRRYLNSEEHPESESLWKLRRIEPPQSA
jgi:NAD(P)-dependent dehydrogenase (short-subunit alcohol dehydrogenase family)